MKKQKLMSRSVFMFLAATLIVSTNTSCFQKGELEGRVVDQSGNPISGAEISIQNSAFRTMSGSRGEYALPYAAGTFLLQLSKSGYTGHQVKLSISEKTRYPVKEIALYRLPEEAGLTLFDETRFDQVNEGTLTSIDIVNSSDPIEQLLSSNASTRLYQVEGVPALLKTTSGAGFLDTDGKTKLLFRVGDNGVIAQRDFGSSMSSDRGNVIDIKPEAYNEGFRIWKFPTNLSEGLYAFACPGSFAGAGLGIGGRDLIGDHLVEAPVYLFEVTSSGTPKVSSNDGYFPITNAFNKAYEKSLKSAETEDWKDAYISLRTALKILPSKHSEENDTRLAKYFKNGLGKAVKAGRWEEAKLIAQLQHPSKDLETLAERVVNASEAEEATRNGHENLKTLVGRWRNRADLLVELEVWREAVNSYETALALLRKLNTASNPNLQDTADKSYDRESRSIRHSLAWLLATCGDASIRNGEKAVEHAKAVVTTWGNNNDSLIEWVCWRTLAAAYAESNDFPTAIKAQNKSILQMGSASLNKSERLEFLQNITNQVVLLSLYHESKPFKNNAPDLDYAWDTVKKRLGREVSHRDLIGAWRYPSPMSRGSSSNHNGVFDMRADGTFEAIRGDDDEKLDNYMTGIWELKSKTLTLRIESDRADSDFKIPYVLVYTVDVLSDGHAVWLDADNRMLVCSKISDYFPSLLPSKLVGNWKRVHTMEAYGAKFVDFIDRPRRLSGDDSGWIKILADGLLIHKSNRGRGDEYQLSIKLLGDALITTKQDGFRNVHRIHNLDDSVLEISFPRQMSTFILQ